MNLKEVNMQALKEAAKQEFKNVSGIEGFGIGDRTLNVYVNNEEIQKNLPETFQEVPINVIVTGEIVAS